MLRRILVGDAEGRLQRIDTSRRMFATDSARIAARASDFA